MFQEIKERIAIIDVLNTYGVKLNSHNKARCPFHNEKTPSFTVYPETNSFYCFGCGGGGDAISFVERLFNLDPLEAAQKLNEDFRLGLSNGELTPEQKYELSEQIKQRDADRKLLAVYQAWEQDYFIYLCDTIHLLDKLQAASKPKAIGDEISADYAPALQVIPDLSNTDKWEPPLPFDNVSVPSFPVGWCLPPSLLNYIKVSVANPAEPKSAVDNLFVKYIYEYEYLANERNKEEINRSRAEKSLLMKELESLMVSVAKGKADKMDLFNKQDELTNFVEIKPLRLFADDTSPEALTSLLASNEGRMSVISSEGGIFEVLTAQFARNLEPRLIDDLEGMADWAGKLHGAVLRIAGILHVVEQRGVFAADALVSGGTMQAAIAIGNYFLEHAKAAYQLMGADERTQVARYVLKKLESQPERQLKRYSIFKMCRNPKIKNVDDIEPYITLLSDFNYLRELPAIERSGAGRKPDMVYALNPLYFRNVV